MKRMEKLRDTILIDTFHEKSSEYLKIISALSNIGSFYEPINWTCMRSYIEH